MLLDEDITLVRQSVTMRQLAEAYGYRVDRSGKISCPFHGKDRHPSMKVYPGDKGYYCFVCGEGGSIFNFVMKHDGLEFEPAVRRVAEMFGIEIADGNIGLSQADRQRIDDLKRQRDEAEKQRKIDQDRLIELGATVYEYERFQTDFEPLSDAWCRLQRIIEQVQQEWMELFDKIYAREE